MTSQAGVFRRGLGAAFDRLHPQMQRRFGVSVEGGYSCVGRGVMHEVRRGPWWTVPFLTLGTFRNIMFPESGNDIPFQIENYAYTDSLGRETVTFVRTMHLPNGRSRRFDATMIYSPDKGRVIDYLGAHQHLAVDLDLAVTDDGALRLDSGAQRFYEGPVAFRFPMIFSGVARLTERFDEEKGVFVIDMQVHNRILGFLFGYRGEFTCEYPEGTDAPASVKPHREEHRE